MHPSSQFILYPLERAPHAIAPGLPVNQEVPAARFSADQDESQEGKGLRIILTALLASFRRMAAELDQLGLFRVQRQRKLREPQAHVLQKPRGLSLMLKSQNTIVGVTHDNHVTGGVTLPPLLRPEIENVVQVNVRHQGRNRRPLWSTLLALRHDPLFKHSGLQPLTNPPKDALVADPLFQEPDHPIVVNRPEKVSDVDVQNPVHLLPLDANNQRIQCIMLTALRPEAVREA